MLPRMLPRAVSPLRPRDVGAHRQFSPRWDSERMVREDARLSSGAGAGRRGLETLAPVRKVASGEGPVKLVVSHCVPCRRPRSRTPTAASAARCSSWGSTPSGGGSARVLAHRTDAPTWRRAPPARTPRPRSPGSASRSSSPTSTRTPPTRGDARRRHLPAPRAARPGWRGRSRRWRLRPRGPERRGGGDRWRRDGGHRRPDRPRSPRRDRRRRGRRDFPGEVVICGSVVPALDVAPGDTVEVRLDPLGSLTVTSRTRAWARASAG
jgi:hypothetical protein